MILPSLDAAVTHHLDPGGRFNDTFKNLTQFVFKFRARTRVILVFLGSIFIIGAWLMPWYTNLYWLSSSAADEVALNTGYQVTNLPAGDPLAAWGRWPLQDEYTGNRLAHGSAYLRSLGFSQQDLYWWIALAALSLIALKTFEWRGQDRLRDSISRIIEGAKAVALIRTIAACAWRAARFTSLTHVNSLARASLLASLRSHGITSPGLEHVHTGFSQGLISLFIGLVLAFLGVFSAVRKPRPNKPRRSGRNGVQVIGQYPADLPPAAAIPVPETMDDRIRVTAGVFAFLALLFLLIAFGVLA